MIMNKTLLLTGLGLMLLACARFEEAPTPTYQAEELVFTAYGADVEMGTKTERQSTPDANGIYPIYWSPGDAISLFFNRGENGGSKFTSQNTEVVPVTDFRGTIEAISGGGESTGGEFWFWGIYPYSTENSCDGSSITTVIPAHQTGKAGSFADNTFITMARSKGLELGFYNICSGVKFTLSRNDIKEVRFRGNNNENIAGKIKAEWDANGKPAITEYVEGAMEVSVTAPGGGTFSAGTDYYLVFAPTLFTQGFTLSMITSDYLRGDFVYENERQFKRGIFVNIPTLDDRVNSWVEASKALPLQPFSISPNGVDWTTITELNFYVHSDKETETELVNTNGYEPIYFEKNGTVANYYTKGEVYQVTEGNGNSLFSGLSNITSIDLSHFDTSMCTDFGAMFSGCLNLKEIIFGEFNTGNATDMSQMFRDCISLETVDLSSFNTANVQNMNYMFLNCYALKELDLSNFDTHNVTQMGEIFEGCYRLEKLDISSFTSDNLEYGLGLFNRCYSLLKLNLGSFDLSILPSSSYTCYKLASRSRNCAVLCTPATKAVLLSSEAQLQGCADYIQWFSPGEMLPDLTMNYDPNLYYSTDYSKDKAVKMLHTATEGNGINVVIMGEAYSDRLIADGTYEQDMTAAMNQVFSIEPFKSFKHLFNVYMVTAVSENEVVGEFTALGYAHDSWFSNGGVDRDDIAINEYVSEAVGRDENREVTTLIVVNQSTGDGVAMVNGGASDINHYDYPARLAGVAFASKSTDPARFKYVVCHEFGHAFAALHDEYVTETGEMETWESNAKKYYQAHVGWWANVSFTSDPSLVGWSQFLASGSGYDETEVSIIEGALYSQGIWKSVDQSMMNAGGEFSVPARVAIYKKIHKVAYGETWQYNFDDFVTWDRHALPKQAARRYSKTKTSKSYHMKPFFKIEEKLSKDGEKIITIIMN